MFPFIASALAEGETSPWLQTKFDSATPVTWITLAALLALGALLLAAGKTSKKWTAKTIAYAALSIALSFVLSYIRLYRLPSGGSVTPGSMLPMMLFAAAFGMGPGLVAGVAYGVLQFLQGGETFGLLLFLLDYILAFAALGLAGLYRKLPKTWGIYAAIVLAGLARSVCHILSGCVLWDTQLWASITYNMSYMLPDIGICLLLAVFVHKPALRVMRA